MEGQHNVFAHAHIVSQPFVCSLFVTKIYANDSHNEPIRNRGRVGAYSANSTFGRALPYHAEARQEPSMRLEMCLTLRSVRRISSRFSYYFFLFSQIRSPESRAYLPVPVPIAVRAAAMARRDGIAFMQNKY